ncbi:hypothetical protein H9P43_008086 [Blastocladiella emersonii ATCC 22665]|nr:hypothetical protein H9P43_008086 [Blastocladiella emersonii ATCC 22665]
MPLPLIKMPFNLPSKGSSSTSPRGSATSLSANTLPAGPVTPADVLKFKKATPDFLVPFTASPPVQFLEFSIKDKASGRVFFETKRPGSHSDYVPLKDMDVPPGVDPNLFRSVHYDFGHDFLDCREVGTTLVFAVGAKPITNFRMIERHYVGDTLIKSFDFTFGFCIPNSVNTWESIYEVPALDKKLKKEMLANPHATKADSFYFVDGVLVMHNKASFEFSSPPSGK